MSPAVRDLTRRELLVGGAAALAATVAGCGAGSDAEVHDLCIIGSGFAGAFLALRAVDGGLRTLLVEAGTRQGDSFAFSNSGGVSYPVDSNRHIGLGGGSNRWAGDVARIWPDELRMHSVFGLGADWPLAYAELAPYYCQAERRLQTQGFAPVRDVEPPRACAYPRQNPRTGPAPRVEIAGRPAAFFRVAKSRRDGAPLRLLDVEIPAFERSPRATLLRDRRAVRLVTRDGTRIDHAELRAPDGALSRVRARRFVVAAGVVETPRLLLLSRSERHPDGLGNRHGLLGSFFTAHPQYWSELETEEVASLPRGHHRSHSLSPAFRRERLNGCWIDLVVRPDLRLWKFSPEIESRSGNRLALSQRRDRFDTAIPDLSLGFSPRDERTIARGTSLRPSFVRERSLDFELGWHGHPSGTCRMAGDERSGVVDRDNRVFGTENLYLSGACTFPTPGTANPTNTVVALTLRLADHLLRLART